MNTKKTTYMLGVCICVGLALPICPGDEKGYLCDEGNKKQYFECNSPWYVGWRDCPTGTVCTDTNKFHSEIPCAVYEQSSERKRTSFFGDDESVAPPDTPKNTNWEAETGALDWKKWWVWAAVAGYGVLALVAGWVGSVTWPSTHKRIAIATLRTLC